LSEAYQQEQASFNVLKQALSSAPVLHTFDQGRRAVLMTDVSCVAVAVILTHWQPDDDSHQHQNAFESSKPTAAERNYTARSKYSRES
jgi:hypothetical protein